MSRHRLTSVLLTFLAIAFTAGPGHAASPPEGTDGLQKARQDIKELKLSRENYFYSLLDARYRQLIAKAVAARRRGGASKKKSE